LVGAHLTIAVTYAAIAKRDLKTMMVQLEARVNKVKIEVDLPTFEP
jgi:hypothetical protein